MKKVTVIHPKYERLHQAMLTVFRIYASDFTAQELLAVASQIVGQLMALQDSSKPDCQARAIAVVMENVEIGNQHAVETAIKMKTKGNA